jgi:cystathionine beta-lyase family protein involved in aluminum resistance
MSSFHLSSEGDQALSLIFSGIDAQVKENLRRVLAAFRNHRVGTHHFSSVSGYGHDDLGRQVLDQVFAEIVGAEAAAVRVQFVSGTHAIACALYGTLRPGDELLAVAGSPYDTLEEVIGVRGNNQGSLAEFGIPLSRTGADRIRHDRLARTRVSYQARDTDGLDPALLWLLVAL